MAFRSGARLGAFQIIGPLGKGGMGEVYRARDTKLGRDVALKVMAETATGSGYATRFEQEAYSLAALNHPHIAGIYEFGTTDSSGVEVDKIEGETAASDEITIHFIVMELVEGETLAERIASGPLSVNEAVGLFMQIAEALEAAHEAGIVHRDLKPANIKITPDDQVKVLDFGIAKWVDRTGARHNSLADHAPQYDSQAPTVPATPTPALGVTEAGMLVGTAFYMSPEQCRGKPVDRRSDIWAFGCCLFECLTRERPFRGATIEETIRAIHESTPDFDKIPRDAPPRLENLLRRCLEKDPKLRLRDIGEAWVELSTMNVSTDPAPPRSKRGLLPALAAVVVIGLIALGVFVARDRFRSGGEPLAGTSGEGVSTAAVVAPPVRRFNINLDPKFPLASRLDYDTPLAFSPDGSTIVYTTTNTSGQLGLAGFPLGSLTARSIVEDLATYRPFFSPDGTRVGFDYQTRFVGVVDLDGAGEVQQLAQIRLALGPSWGDDGYIYFASGLGQGISRVRDSGGDPEIVTTLQSKPRELMHAFPRILPGSRGLLYASLSKLTIDGSNLMLLNRQTGTTTLIAERAGGGFFVPPGHLVFPQGTRLIAVPFDLETLAVTGPSADVTEASMTDGRSAITQIAISGRGSLAYVPATAESRFARMFLTWVAMDGTADRISKSASAFFGTQLSPDGSRVGMTMRSEGDEGFHVWLYDIERGTETRETFDGMFNQFAGWAPGGTSFVVRSESDDTRFYRQNVGEARQPTEFLQGWNIPLDNLYLQVIAPDESYALFLSLKDNADIVLADLLSGDQPRELLDGDYNEVNPAVSPDGNWIAYQSDETGTMNVYVQEFPNLGSKVKVSLEEGFAPVWHPDGSKLYFLSSPDKMMVVDVHLDENSIDLSVPRVQFTRKHGYEAYWGRQYDIHPDGTKFLMADADGEVSGIGQIVIVENWVEVLKEKAPSDSATTK